MALFLDRRSPGSVTIKGHTLADRKSKFGTLQAEFLSGRVWHPLWYGLVLRKEY